MSTRRLCDLRGYGDSSKPEGEKDHSTYSKRPMALDSLQESAPEEMLAELQQFLRA